MPSFIRRFVLSWLCLCLLCSSGARAEQKFFGGDLILPGMDGYHRFSEAHNRGQGTPTRWDPKQKDIIHASNYLLCHPDASLWVTVRRLPAPSSADLKTAMTQYESHLSSAFAKKKVKASPPKTVTWPGGQAVVLEVPDFAPGYTGRSICLFPKEIKPRSQVYLVTVVATNQSKAQGQKLSDLIIKKANLRL